MSLRPTQLTKLAKPFPDSLVKKAPQGKFGSYVSHHSVVQALLATVGPYDLEVVEILRGDYKELSNVVVGAVVRLTLEVDGKRVRIEEVGDCEQPGNWQTDGARLKDCISDGLKRAAARVGLGLHLYAQDSYFLEKSLLRGEVTE